MSELYLIAIGSNARVPGIGDPRRVVAAAFEALEAHGAKLLACGAIIDSAPIGPSLRRYANSACVVESALSPPELLRRLQSLEHQFGRTRNQRRGQRWRARALDLDIILWSGGVWASPDLTIPHREMRGRDFVLGPASAIAGHWRDPVSGLSLAHLRARLSRKQRGPQKQRAPIPAKG
ncbi:MAG: 2-amino-4-hydroxy-6-hydroxymethyldihydropteridine diphosphokinase [Pseudomonadota bacterium]